jgi:prepilin signal peptidase PulO-like enzyme (type II secretory pathway)
MKYFLIPTESLVSFLIIAVIEYLILGNVKRSMFLDFSIPISWSLLFFLMVYLQPQKMGFADIYLVGLMTFAVGFPASLFLPTVASFFAILYFFIKYRNIPWVEARKNKIPFGVFLSLAFLILKIIPIPDIF